MPPDQMREFLRDRKGAIVGRKLVDTYGFKVGDQVSLRGTIFPGQLGVRGARHLRRRGSQDRYLAVLSSNGIT